MTIKTCTRYRETALWTTGQKRILEKYRGIEFSYGHCGFLVGICSNFVIDLIQDQKTIPKRNHKGNLLKNF